MNEQRRQIDQAFRYIKDGDLRRGVAILRAAASGSAGAEFIYRIDAIDEDFRRMLEYMRGGYNDPARRELYSSLLKRLYAVAADMSLSERIKDGGMLAEAHTRVAALAPSHEQIRQELETFVADVAMLSLDITDGRDEQEKELYKRHYKYMSQLFDLIVVSPQWKTADADFYRELILSPTIDSADALLLTSAVTIACLCEFDFGKLKTLAGVYTDAADEPLRQRSLVGWLIALHGGRCFEQEKASLTRELCADERTVHEVVDTQRQMLFCMNAEKDHEKIQRDIMPTLVENNNFNITPDGIIEREDDPMDDILGRESGDRRMEKLERSIGKMLGMQRAGSDIYFGGFSQMKRFPFFYTPSNWFVPFSTKHPGLQRTAEKLKGSNLLTGIFEASPFCDSDKYSLSLAMTSVVDKIPEQMRELLSTEGFVSPLDEEMKTDSPEYIRRMYLQDLYRFFRLYPQKQGIASPFDNERFVIVADSAFRNSPLQASLADLCLFFHKHKNGDALRAVLIATTDSDDAQIALFRGVYSHVYQRNYHRAIPHYELYLEKEPDDTSAMHALATSYMATRRYDKGLELYTRLTEACPDVKLYSINRCRALLRCKRFDDAEKAVYRLYFDYPDDLNVLRVLVRTLMEQGRLEEADLKCARAMSHERSSAYDKLNAGYCKWFMGNITEAAALLAEYRSGTSDRSLAIAFSEDSDMLQRHGIDHTDLMLMTYIIGQRA